MIQPSVCGEWKRKKNEKYGHVNKLLKSISVYKRKEEKKKNHRHNKIWSWHCARKRKKRKEVEKNKSEKNTWV